MNYTPDNAALYIVMNIYSKLAAFDTVNNAMYPGLAETWDISPDLKTYTLHLRRGVTWHDGKPFTAADVTWTIEDIKRERATRPSRPNSSPTSTGWRPPTTTPSSCIFPSRTAF